MLTSLAVLLTAFWPVAPAHALTMVGWHIMGLDTAGHCTPSHPTVFYVHPYIQGTVSDYPGGDAYAIYLLDSADVVLDNIGPYLMPVGNSGVPTPRLGTNATPSDGPFRFVIHDLADSSELLPVGGVFGSFGDVPVDGIRQIDPVSLDRGCAPPAVNSFSSNSGSHSGGSLVTIMGQGFSAAAEVLIDGATVDATDVSVSGTTQIVVTMPPSPTGPGDVEVVVRTPAGTSSPEAFTYTNAAPVAVDNEYTITQGQALSVSAPGLLDNDSDVDGDPIMLASANAGSPIEDWPDFANFIGSLLVPRDGSFQLSAPAEFFGMATFIYSIYDESLTSNYATVTIGVEPTVPVVASVSADRGPLAGGTSVTISGSNFLGATGVTFGGIAATTYTVVDNSTITATVPAGNARGPVAVGVHKVDADAGMDVSGVGPDGFTYLAPGALSVTSIPDDSEFEATGRIGGPFTPNSILWRLHNTGDEAIDVLIEYLPGGDGPSFLNPVPPFNTPFQIEAGAVRDLHYYISANAAVLPAGLYSADIRFTNLTNAIGTSVRRSELLIVRHQPTVGVVSSLSPSTVGDPVTFTATVTGGYSPTGSVEFYSDGNSLGSVALADGSAAIDVTTLALGTHQITAVYSGDIDNAGATSVALTQVVDQHVTSLSVISSLNPSLAGDEVSFTATLTGGLAPAGTVEFFSGADSLGVESVSSGAATLDISTLAVGSHQITAVYSGDINNAGSTSAPLSQIVEAMPELVLRVETDGYDGSFAFTSPEAALNLSISTSGGSGQSAPLPLRSGSYSVSMADRRADGLLLTAITCSDADSVAHVDTRSLDITLSPAEVLVCTFTIANSAQQTLEEIAAFLEARANVLLANLPSAQRRFARLNGSSGATQSPGSVLMGYLPILANGGALSGAASLAQIESLVGNEQPLRFDAWIEGTFGLYGHNGAEGRFGLVSFGADYLVTDDLLIGGFFQIDQLSQENATTGATAGGAGWMAGPYLTARLSESLYLDLMVAGGQAQNRVSPSGTYEDWYGSTRFLASAALQGEWSYGAWTFAPATSLSWFSETSNAYTDSLGVAIPSTSVEKVQFATGPGVRYTQGIGNGVTLSTSTRFEAVAGYSSSLLVPGQGNMHGRISGGLDFGFAGGATLGISLSHDGLFGTAGRSTSVNLRVNAPLN